MTPLDLQQSLMKELTALFADQLFLKPKNKTTDPDELVPLNIYRQALPMKDGFKYTSYVPYISVQLKSGKQTEETEPGEVVVFLNICVYDNDEMNQGHELTLNMIEKIRQHVFEKRIIGGKYSVKLPYEWELSDEEIYPFFVTIAETHWYMPVTVPENPNL